MRVYYHTFGCKANQYETERMRQEVEARGGERVERWEEANVCVVNTCTVTSQADAEARRFARRLRRGNSDARIVLCGCSAALSAPELRALPEVNAVVEGRDPVAVAAQVRPGPSLVQLSLRSALDRIDSEPVGAELLRQRVGATRGWLKVQDGCDRKCSFCATRLARGRSQSRPLQEILAEAKLLAVSHPELVITGIHIGHYGCDLAARLTLSGLVGELLQAVPDVRFRLGSVEATEVDDHLLDLMVTSGGRLAPHVHMPLQSGADAILRKMRRWHTREAYRRRALEIASRLPVLGLGGDLITGFPGETDEDHASTAALVEELPYTYLHIFPFSPRRGTAAAALQREQPVPQRVAGERSRELRALVARKAERYRAGRVGARAEVSLEGRGDLGLTEDYLRVQVSGGDTADRASLARGILQAREGHLYIDLPGAPSEPGDATARAYGAAQAAIGAP